MVNDGNEYIYGDWKYGDLRATPNGFREGNGTGGSLDKDIWGDADIIIQGKGDGSKKSKIHGGDGNDEIHMGDAWA